MKILVILSLLISLPVFAQQFSNLTKKDVENVTEEFGANFSHTVVAAPETKGIWGIEAGVVAGMTASPKFKGVIEDSGGDGKKFKNIYNAAVFGRLHVPFDLFVEAAFLPEQEIQEIKFKSQSFGAGWNAGGFFKWPVDLALGFSQGSGEINFTQTQDTTTVPVTPAADISFETKTTIYYAALSKTFLFATPYAKFGTASINGQLDANASIFGYTAEQSEDISLSGGYMAFGINVNFLFLKIGAEYSKVLDVSKTAAKLSFDI
jgi:hypothetical protein